MADTTDDIPALVREAEKVANYHALHGTWADAAFIRSLAAALTRLTRERDDWRAEIRGLLDAHGAAITALATALRERDEARVALARYEQQRDEAIAAVRAARAETWNRAILTAETLEGTDTATVLHALRAASRAADPTGEQP